MGLGEGVAIHGLGVLEAQAPDRGPDDRPDHHLGMVDGHWGLKRPGGLALLQESDDQTPPGATTSRS